MTLAQKAKIMGKHKFTPYMFLVLESIYEDIKALQNYHEYFEMTLSHQMECQTLHRMGYIKFMSKDMSNYENIHYLQLTSKGKSLFGTEQTSKQDVTEWIAEYREPFGEIGKQIGKVGLMGSKSNCIKNMVKFFKENPDVTKEQIFNARDAYFEQERRNNFYKYLQRADYFIYKEGGSRLESFVEELDSIEDGQIEERRFGIDV